MVSAISVLVKKIFTKSRSDVHYFLTDFSYRPISLISSIMKILRSHVEHIGFIDKHQSGFRKAKSTDDHIFRLSQSIMESFNRGEHAVTAFLDIEKAFDNVWHNGLRFKIF